MPESIPRCPVCYARLGHFEGKVQRLEPIRSRPTLRPFNAVPSGSASPPKSAGFVPHRPWKQLPFLAYRLHSIRRLNLRHRNV
jgi:hypothetical protein